MSIFSSLTRSQKEAIGLLQIGTFLEYFDLMLYVHMAVLLNELFFPKYDPHTAALLAAFAFCSTYVLRPFGALIFGYIGDTIGRKATVIITTVMMSISCVVMANLPTYAEIGIKAAYVVTICRIVQGLSSMGEAMGAMVYVSEILKPPAQYVGVSCVSIATNAGAIVALGVASLVTTIELNWRIAFWVGAGIAVVGSVARYRLRETADFLHMKSKKASGEKFTNKSTIKDWVYYFLIYCGWPISFYLGYMYFNPLLKSKFGYSAENIINHNFYVALVPFFTYCFWTWLSVKIRPLKILKIKGIVLLTFTCFLPFCINQASSPLQVFLIQAILLSFSMSAIPGESIFITHFPVQRRLTVTCFIYALSRAVMYVITSFSLVYITEWLGYYGLWIVLFPVVVSFLLGVQHFEKFNQPKYTFAVKQNNHRNYMNFFNFKGVLKRFRAQN